MTEIMPKVCKNPFSTLLAHSTVVVLKGLRETPLQLLVRLEEKRCKRLGENLITSRHTSKASLIQTSLRPAS